MGCSVRPSPLPPLYGGGSTRQCPHESIANYLCHCMLTCAIMMTRRIPKGATQPPGCRPDENQFFINGDYVSEEEARAIIADLKQQLKVETERMKENERLASHQCPLSLSLVTMTHQYDSSRIENERLASPAVAACNALELIRGPFMGYDSSPLL